MSNTASASVKCDVKSDENCLSCETRHLTEGLLDGNTAGKQTAKEEGQSEHCDTSFDSTLEAGSQVDGLSMKDLSELLAQEDTVSVVIISEDGQPVDWLQRTDIIVEKQAHTEHASGDCEMSQPEFSQVQYISLAATDVPQSDSSDSSSITVKMDTGNVAAAQIKVEPMELETEDGHSHSFQSALSHSVAEVHRLAAAAGTEKISAENENGALVHPNLGSVKTEVNSSHEAIVHADESQIVYGLSAPSGKPVLHSTTQDSVTNSHSPIVSIYTSTNSALSSKGSGGTSTKQESSAAHFLRTSQRADESVSSNDATVPSVLLPNYTHRKAQVSSEDIAHKTKSVSTSVLQSGISVSGLASTSTVPQVQSGGGAVDVTASSSSGTVSLTDSGMVYRCAECDYASSNKHYYKQHVDLVHKTERPFKCPFCDYAGKRGHALREHLVIHSVEDPFTCSQCNATFRKKAHLTTHTKLHSATSNSDVVKVGQGTPGRIVVLSSLPGSPAKLISVPQTQAGSAVRVLSPGMQSAGSKANKAGPGTGAAGLWCALCKQTMADATAFQAHLQSVHGTDRLFACEQCDFVAADQPSIMAHLPTHLSSTVSAATTTLATSPPKVTLPATPASVPLGCRPLYSCTDCSFTTPSMNQLIAHAKTHAVAASVSSATISSVATPSECSQKKTQQGAVAKEQASAHTAAQSKMMCSECGLVADDVETMRTHMWAHIKNTEVKDKTSTVNTITEVQQSAAETTASSAMRVIQRPATEIVGVKSLPQNAAFKCTDCDFTSRDASLFVKHMLVHKTRQKSAEIRKIQPAQLTTTAQAQTGTAKKIETVSVSVVGNTQQNQAYQVRPVTTDNTCKNSENTPFVHDASAGRFRCTICDYTCEYQRTIKAHIWKHSGHHQVDYPIFQNGPLSLYEDPVPRKTTPPPSHPLVSVPGLKIVQVVEKPVTSSPKLTLVPVTAPSQQPAPDTPGKHIILRVMNRTGAAKVSTAGTVENKTSLLEPGNEAFGPKLASDKSFAVQCKNGENGSVQNILKTESVHLACKQMLTANGKPNEASTQSVHGESVCKEMPLLKIDLDVESGCEGENHKALCEVISSYSGNTVDCHRAYPVEKLGVMKSTNPSAQQAACAEISLESTGESSADSHVTDAEVMEGTTGDLASDDLPTETSKIPTKISGKSVSSEAQGTTGSDGLAADLTISDSATTMKKEKKDRDYIEQNEVMDGVKAAPSCVSENVARSIDNEGPSITQSTKQHDMCEPSRTTVKNEPSGREQKFITERSGSVESMETESVASPSNAPNVVVEALPSLYGSSALTGLRSQNASPRALRSQASSPVGNANIDSFSLPASQKLVQKPEASKPVSEMQPEPENSKKALKRSADTNSPENQTPQKVSKIDTQTVINSAHKADVADSESAVTLLSLLKRGPNFNPACPRGDSGPFITDTGSDITSDQSPDRPTSADSDSDSKGAAVEDQASEDTVSEVESSVSGKSRGGSGGICSSLLAVIEQLRERSRSESDAEDRSSQPQPKKRTSRRRGRRESQDEALSPEDGENVEQLEGEETVTYRCKLCHYTSSRTPLIRLHMRTHRQKDPFECSLCPMVAGSSEELQEHMIQHCKVRTYPCKFCPQAFNHKSTLRAHMRAHNDSEPFLCDLCEYETANPLEYRDHMQKHTGLALLKCPHCPVLVASHRSLQSHLASGCTAQSKSEDGEQKGLSDEGKHGSLSSGPTSSIQDAAPRERLLCSQCDFYAHDLSGLREHTSQVHGVGPSIGSGSGEGPLRCALCEFTAVSSRSLKSHMKRHANDQRYVQQPLEQYKCALCGYVCHHLPSLKSHMWRHASDQNYSYQFTNDVINAAIDYDTRVDLAPQSMGKGGSDEEPELLERFLSAERRILEGQLSKMVSKDSDPLCWVTFRCCQCGFETINKAKLNLHMRTHADIINRTLKVKVDAGSAGAAAPDDLDPEKVKLKVVYEPV